MREVQRDENECWWEVVIDRVVSRNTELIKKNLFRSSPNVSSSVLNSVILSNNT